MSERTKRVWRGLVSYANSTPTTIDLDEFRRTVAYCMPWYVAAGPLGLFAFLREEEELRQAQQYQPLVQGLLRWLITRPEERGSLFQEACGFLYEHMQHIRWRLVDVERPEHIVGELKRFHYTPAELARFHEQTERYWADATIWASPPSGAPRGSPGVLKIGDSLLGISTPAKEYDDLADPICDFFLTEYQKYREREHSRKDKKRAPLVPIFACPNCNKLVMPERVGRRKYCSDCSDKARAKSYLEKASPDENKDYQWLYRLKEAKPEVRRARLRQQKVQERLAEIKARKKNSHRCKELIRRMGLHVAPTS
jgi:hypothetical protein